MEQLTPETIQTVEQLGQLVKRTRVEQGISQKEFALFVGTGNRFIVDLEAGKPTIQFQKILDVLQAIGGELQVVIRGKE